MSSLREQLRYAVYRWCEFKYRHDDASIRSMVAMVKNTPDPERAVRNILTQVQHDIWHSDLLLRMLDLHEPLSEEQYRAYCQKARGLK